jgi:transaldolase / glucose-6-phosphate isomerase
MTQNALSYSLPELIQETLEADIEAWEGDERTAGIWRKDAGVWTGGDEAKWLGWLDIAGRELGEIEKYARLREDVEAGGFSHILLMGMGGSSLCPEVLAKTFGIENFHILDSTVPSQVKAVEAKLDIGKTLFIVASKSGGTLETNCFKQYFFDRVSQEAGAENAGKQFIAITDPGSKMESIAQKDGFRHIIHGEPEVGGRFSALSVFGMTPAAAMGLDVGELLSRADAMAESCRAEKVHENPGALLGLILGSCNRHGRDKLTIFSSPELSSLGPWLEQLIAESTGKHGKAIIPVEAEPLQPAVSYGSDRVFVHLKLEGTPNDKVDLGSLYAAGHPVIQIEIAEKYDLGAEFYRWEFATAVAGSVMGINPFDQPDVESAKVAAREVMSGLENSGELPEQNPFFETESLRLYSSAEYGKRLVGMIDEPQLAEILSAHFANVEEGDYFAVLGFIEMNEANEKGLGAIRAHVLEKRLAATCLGFGPRFLHSTGQAYKGGPNTGVFLQITAEDKTDVEVPGETFSFGKLKDAQAMGDLNVLLGRGRRVLRVHIDASLGTEKGLEKLIEAMRSIVSIGVD